MGRIEIERLKIEDLLRREALSIAELIKSTGYKGHYVVGLRALRKGQGIGELAPSYNGADDSDYERLPGTSAVYVGAVEMDLPLEQMADRLDGLAEALERVVYYGDRIGVVIGDRVDWGQDAREMLLANAECIGILG